MEIRIEVKIVEMTDERQVTLYRALLREWALAFVAEAVEEGLHYG